MCGYVKLIETESDTSDITASISCHFVESRAHRTWPLQYRVSSSRVWHIGHDRFNIISVRRESGTSDIIVAISIMSVRRELDTSDIVASIPCQFVESLAHRTWPLQYPVSSSRVWHIGHDRFSIMSARRELDTSVITASISCQFVESWTHRS